MPENPGVPAPEIPAPAVPDGGGEPGPTTAPNVESRRAFGDYLFGLMSGYFGTWVVALGSELGIFTELADGPSPRDAADIARSLDLDPRYL